MIKRKVQLSPPLQSTDCIQPMSYMLHSQPYQLGYYSFLSKLTLRHPLQWSRNGGASGQWCEREGLPPPSPIIPCRWYLAANQIRLRMGCVVYRIIGNWSLFRMFAWIAPPPPHTHTPLWKSFLLHCLMCNWPWPFGLLWLYVMCLSGSLIPWISAVQFPGVVVNGGQGVLLSSLKNQLCHW